MKNFYRLSFYFSLMMGLLLQIPSPLSAQTNNSMLKCRYAEQQFRDYFFTYDWEDYPAIDYLKGQFSYCPDPSSRAKIILNFFNYLVAWEEVQVNSAATSSAIALYQWLKNNTYRLEEVHDYDPDFVYYYKIQFGKLPSPPTTAPQPQASANPKSQARNIPSPPQGRPKTTIPSTSTTQAPKSPNSTIESFRNLKEKLARQRATNPTGPLPSSPTKTPINPSPRAAFPIPFPQVSAWGFLDSLLASPQGYTLGQYSSLLIQTLKKGKYPGIKFYPVPGGFAMISPLEKIAANGFPDFWHRFDYQPKIDPKQDFTLSTYFPHKDLKDVEAGYYRLWVFLLSTDPFPYEPQVLTAQAQALWQQVPTHQLPPRIAQSNVSPQHRALGLVYEWQVFRPESKKRPQLLYEGLSLYTHLERSGMLSTGREKE